MQLEPATASQNSVVSVSQLTASIKAVLEGGIGPVSVRGELSNCRPAASGHIYFVLKDAEATLSAALFRGAAARCKNVQLRDGVEVICHGRLSVYPPRGSYQIIVESMEPVGAGSLQAAFEALKKKLQAEGLFDPEKKRPIPSMPERVVVITSPTGAAIRDVLSVMKRRFSGVKVLLIPAVVQGEQAPKELIRALRTANEHELGDVILLTRGGGSLEDLWCFNNEELAREIRASQIPVVSAVGHEIDFTIADFVADLRAPTPSAAAELLTREFTALIDTVQEERQRLVRCMRQQLHSALLRLQAVSGKLRNPRDRINELRQRFDDWSERLQRSARHYLEGRSREVGAAVAALRALSPVGVLERGYSLVYLPDGRLLRSATQAKTGARLAIRVADGTIGAEVSE